MKKQITWCAVLAVFVAAMAGCSAPADSPSGTPTTAPASVAGLAADVRLGLQWTEGNGDAVFSQNADGTDRRLVTNLPDGALHPDWSPDGQRLAYRSSVGGTDQIWIAEADGSDPRVLAPCGGTCFGADFPAWSPDSGSLVYTAYDAPLSDDLPPAGSTLRVIDVESGDEAAVLASAPGEILDNARWSPDGELLAFQIDQFDASGVETALQIAVAPAAGGEIRKITDGSMFASYPDWNPVDSRIVFTTYDLGAFETLPDGAASNLATIDVDGGGLTALTDLPPGGARVTQPSWTLDGTAVLATNVSKSGTRSAAIVPGVGGDAVILPGGGATHVKQIPAT
ncbi:hypothetical protein BH11ACT3_BH11ACT3_25690 [soil metagenome]